MKKTVRENIKTAYSLHDMRVASFEIRKDQLTMHLATGMIQTGEPGGQPDGQVEFHRVCWDFSYAYLLQYQGLAGNTGPFRGEKLFLQDFLGRFPDPVYTILDETYGYNQTKYSGFLHTDDGIWECMLEICHDGDMIFVSRE